MGNKYRVWRADLAAIQGMSMRTLALAVPPPLVEIRILVACVSAPSCRILSLSCLALYDEEVKCMYSPSRL
jgi:hypothetical protein